LEYLQVGNFLFGPFFFGYMNVELDGAKNGVPENGPVNFFADDFAQFLLVHKTVIPSGLKAGGDPQGYTARVRFSVSL
jgi:hypothetical protein